MVKYKYAFNTPFQGFWISLSSSVCGILTENELQEHKKVSPH